MTILTHFGIWDLELFDGNVLLRIYLKYLTFDSKKRYILLDLSLAAEVKIRTFISFHLTRRLSKTPIKEVTLNSFIIPYNFFYYFIINRKNN